MKDKQWLVIGRKSLDKDKFTPVQNQRFVKPHGGLWASPYTPEDKYKSAWHEFTMKEFNKHENPNEAVVFSLKEDARIYVIDSQEDLINLADTYGYNQVMICFLFLDFENISKHFDAIYLTNKGQSETRFPLENYKYNLYGWDVSSILVMNFDCISQWKYIDISK